MNRNFGVKQDLALPRKFKPFLAMERQRSWKHGIFRPYHLDRGFFSQRARLYPLDEYGLSLFLNDWKIEFRIGELNDPTVQEFLSKRKRKA